MEHQLKSFFIAHSEYANFDYELNTKLNKIYPENLIDVKIVPFNDKEGNLVLTATVIYKEILR